MANLWESLLLLPKVITGLMLESDAPRVITVAGDVEKTTNRHHLSARFYHNYHNRIEKETLYQNDVKVTIPSSIFIKIYFSF